MSHDRLHSSIPICQKRLSDLAWDEMSVGASPDNVSAEPECEITLARDTGPDDVNTHLKPTRPSRHPLRPTPLHIVPKSSPSFNSCFHIDDPFPVFSQISDSSKDPSKRIVWLSTASPPPTPPVPSLQTGFLDRIPKPIAIDDDSASTLSSITSRLPSVPPLCSYKRPSTGSTRDQSDEICRSLPARLPHHDLVPTNAGASAAAESAPKSSLVNLTSEGKKTVLSPLSFMRMRTASEASFSPPVTASTLSNGSVLSFIVDDTQLAWTAEATSETDSVNKGKRALFWKLKNMSRRQVNLEVYEEVLPEPKPSFLITPLELGAPPSALRVEIRPEEEEEDNTRDEDAKAGVVRCRKLRRIWRRLMGGH